MKVISDQNGMDSINDIIIGKIYRVLAQPPHTEEQDIIFTDIDEKKNRAKGYVVGKKRIKGDHLYTYNQVRYMINVKLIIERN